MYLAPGVAMDERSSCAKPARRIAGQCQESKSFKFIDCGLQKRFGRRVSQFHEVKPFGVVRFGRDVWQRELLSHTSGLR